MWKTRYISRKHLLDPARRKPERPAMTPTPQSAPEPGPAAAAAPRPTVTTTADQATIGKSLVIKGEVTGSEALYIDGRVEGSINLAGNRVTVGRNGVVNASVTARENRGAWQSEG